MARLLNKKINKFIIIIFLSIFSCAYAFSEIIKEVRILKKINNKIITNFDVEKEYNYLLALNNNLKSLPSNEVLKIAEESLVREIIKLNEIKKFVDIKTIQNRELIEKIISNITNNLNFENKQELEDHLKLYNLSIIEIEEKLIIEVLWNQLISSKFKNQINIDKNDLAQRIKKENLINTNIIEYELSEIVFEVKNNNELENVKNLIYNSIESIGFKNSALKYSMSDTSKIGGYLGKIKENQLSNKIKESLLALKIGEYSKPINIGGNFLILYVDNKQTIKEVGDANVLLEKMIDFERQKQLNNFSQIYFNKIKINTLINEY